MNGWYSRGYLPHFDEPNTIQFITFRLADSMPQSVLQAYAEALERGEITEREQWKRIENYLDRGHGACWLKTPAIASMVDSALRYFDGKRYRLIAWCVMPNHVHALAEMWEDHPLEEVVHSWKSYTAHQANKTLGRSGRFWQPEGFDRFMRSTKHLLRTLEYIENNPGTAGLAEQPEDWPYSSARFRSNES